MKHLLLIIILFLLNNIQLVSSKNSQFIKIDKSKSSFVTLSDSSMNCFNEGTHSIEFKNLEQNKLSAYAEIIYVRDLKHDTIHSVGNIIDKIGAQNKTIRLINIYFKNTINKKDIQVKFNNTKTLTHLQLSQCVDQPIHFTKNGKYYYIPEYEYDSISTLKINSEDKAQNGQDLLLFNIKQGKTKLNYYHGNDPKNKDNSITDFKAVVGNYVTLKVYSDIGDSISITNNYTNLHLENQSMFQSIANQQADTVKKYLGAENNNISKAYSTSPKSDNSTEKNNQNEKILALSDELGIYLQYISEFQPSKRQWNTDVLYIKENICKNFNMIDFSLDSLKTITHNKLIVDQWKAIESYNPPIYISTMPKQIENNDILTFNVQLFNKGKEIQSGTYNYYTKSGFKVDYSVGLVFHTLTDQSLSIKETSDNTNSYKTILAEKKDNVTPGAGLFAHFYGRTGGWFNYGLMTGFEIAADSKPKYLAGLSFLIGREQRVVISPGFILGQVKVLSSKYDVNVPYLSSSFGNLSVDQILVNQYKFGYFVSISYNLSK